MAFYSDHDISEIIQKFGMPRVTPKSIIRSSKLRDELKRVRHQGYAFDDDEEATMGLRCVASAIYNEHGEPSAAISTSGPTARIPDDRLISLGPVVAGCAAQITHAIGANPPQYSHNAR